MMKQLFTVVTFLFVCAVPFVGYGQEQASVIENGTFDSSKGWFNHVEGNGSIEVLTGELIVTGPNRDEDDIPNPIPATVYAYQDIQVIRPGSLVFKLVSYASIGDSGNNDYPVFILDNEILKLYENGSVEGHGGSGRQINNDRTTGNHITYVVKLKPGKYRIGFGVHTIDGYYGRGVAVFDEVMFKFDR